MGKETGTHEESLDSCGCGTGGCVACGHLPASPCQQCGEGWMYHRYIGDIPVCPPLIVPEMLNIMTGGMGGDPNLAPTPVPGETT